MTIWTTFTPQKVSWELTTVQTKGKGGDGNWTAHLPLIESALKQLKGAGITGIRLVIYPYEISQDGKTFDFKPIETMLDLCKKLKVQVDLCIGPFQYPNYPGIYLPKNLLTYVFDGPNSLDTKNPLRQYADDYLEKQMDRYSEDKRIRGFHFANEWPDYQRVSGREKVRTWISEAYMVQAASVLKKRTKKPISMNTNIDASDKRKLATVFSEVLGVLEDQGRLGFDIYPSQETWSKAFLQKLRRLFEPYHRSYNWCTRKFPLCEMYFCEVEAQPWGSGQSWYRMINDEPNPQEKVLQFINTSLQKTFEKYIKQSKPYEVSLWGGDFWLCAHAMGVTWPLDQVKAIAKEK